MKIYDFCLANHRHQGYVRFYKGMRNFFKGKFQEAFDDTKEYAQQFIAKKIESIVGDTTALLCGKVAAAVDKHEFAESCYTCFLEENPDCKEAYFERALVRLELEKPDKALADYILSGLHPVLLGNQLQLRCLDELRCGVKEGFNGMAEMNVFDVGLLPDSFIDRVDAKIKHSVKGAKASLDFLSGFIESVAEVAQYHLDEVPNIKIPELAHLIQYYDTLEDCQRGSMIGGMIKKYGINAFSKQSNLQAVDFYRDIKNMDSWLQLEDLLESQSNSPEKGHIYSSDVESSVGHL